MRTERQQFLHPGWTLVLPLLAMTALILCPPERRLYTSLVSAPTYALLQWLLPRCRLRVEHYFCPINIALILLLLKLVVVPILVMLIGPESRVLATLPPFSSMEAAIQIDTLAYIAFCLGLTWAPQGPYQPKSSSLARALSTTPSVPFIYLFAAMGLVGFAAAFGSPGALIAYFTEPIDVTIQEVQDATIVALLGTFLRPFLAFALIAWWSHAVAESGPGLWRPAIVGIVAAIGITLANMTFSFNRAAFCFPLFCMAAVYSARIRRIPIWSSLAALALALPILIGVSYYRSGSATANAKPDRPQSGLADASENIQAYSGGPQFTGLFYDRIGWGEHPYLGATLLASAMAPVPVLGKTFRDNSGPTIFNYAIYGVYGIEDQIIPFATELFANFHAPGVLLGFVFLAWFLSQAERWFIPAQSMFSAFAIQYVAMWGAMMASWSLAIYSQILIYFFVPIYFYLAVLRILSWLKGFNRPRYVASVGVAQ